MVSNKFHRSQDNFYWYTSAFEVPEISVEPIWRTAMRYGLKTAAAFWFGAHPDFADQVADYTVSYGRCDVYSAMHVLTFTLASEWQNVPPSFSPYLESTLDILGKGDARVARLYVLALDTTDDGELNYDTLILDDNRRVEESPLKSPALRLDEWAPMEISSHLHSGAYFKLQAITVTVESVDEISATVPLEAAPRSSGLRSRGRRAVDVRPRCLRDPDRARRHDRRAGRGHSSGAHGIIGAGPQT